MSVWLDKDEDEVMLKREVEEEEVGCGGYHVTSETLIMPRIRFCQEIDPLFSPCTPLDLSTPAAVKAK